MSHIIFLHGASSSGKSTIALAIQAKIELPFWHISIDHLRDSGVLPTRRFQTGEFSWQEAKSGFFDGFHASLKAYADAGNNLILEHIIDKENWLEDLQTLFQDHQVYFVGVHCPLDVLEARERVRGNRPLGSARQDFDRIHKDKVYDLEIQSMDPLKVNVTKIIEGWRARQRLSSFTA
jgi:chloramphenicol 3-O phosphotransferase